MALRYNNAELIKTRHDLENKISELTEEKKIIESKFSSLIELKKAILQVKIEIRSEKIKQKKEKIRQQKEIDKWETARGNKGFFTRGGEEYYKPKVKVEVRLEDANLNKKAP